MQSVPKIKYWYLNVFGRGELARIILHYNKIDFEDIRFTFQEWYEKKAKGETEFAPCNQLPVLNYDGYVVTQSYVIGRFLCVKLGQYPADSDLATQVEELRDFINLDINEDYVQHFNFQDKEKREEFLDEFFDKRLPNRIKCLNDYVKKNGCNGFMVGKSISLADFAMLEVGNRLFFNPKWGPRCKQYIEKYPELTKYYETRHADPGWQEYLKRRLDSAIDHQ